MVKDIVKIRFGSEYDDGAYIEDVYCLNCNAHEQVLIKKGHPKKEVLPIVCPCCGCKDMR